MPDNAVREAGGSTPGDARPRRRGPLVLAALVVVLAVAVAAWIWVGRRNAAIIWEANMTVTAMSPHVDVAMGLPDISMPRVLELEQEELGQRADALRAMLAIADRLLQGPHPEGPHPESGAYWSRDAWVGFLATALQAAACVPVLAFLQGDVDAARAEVAAFDAFAARAPADLVAVLDLVASRSRQRLRDTVVARLEAALAAPGLGPAGPERARRCRAAWVRAGR